ncbi:MAG TPA: hypothetical protein VK717_12800, partial [Opitutaceae bacterium]|nr:hypothetical protein [Opitutaceae bacterium]
MLKDRKEGVVYLHWCALTIAAIVTYLSWVAFAKVSPGFQEIQRTNILEYLLGVVIAAFWAHQGLPGVAHRLGNMGLIESIRHARHQLIRFIAVLFTLAFVMKDS